MDILSQASTVGRLIVVEGPENTGKSTLARAISEELLSRNIRALYTAFPGHENGTLGSLVYKVEHQRENYLVKPMTATARQLMHLAAHADAIDQLIKPALASGTWIVLDRYYWSLYAHGLAQGIGVDMLDMLVDFEKLLWQGTVPDLIICTLQPRPFSEPWTKEWQLIADGYASLVQDCKFNSMIITNDDASVSDRVNSFMENAIRSGLLP